MKEHLSPEEKLLGLIKGKSRKPEMLPQVVAVSVEPKQQQKPGWLKVDLRLGFKDALRSFEQVFFSAAGIKTVLWASFVLSCIYLGFSLVYPLFGLRTIALPKVDSRSGREIVQPALKENKPFEYYVEAARGKQIFGGAVLQESGAAPVRGSADLIKDFNLLGVISGDNPQAVIEDKKIQKSFTVTKGQFIGEFQVEDIKEGKVMLNYQGQRFELSM